ncbi:hypothetical protein D3874_11470 [Oleomonas cavernae]|uniref:Uncharacterized protein n=1 Tax=Oleomonas cavernae TaxID=2320859 RepID=A0A418WBZ7_9PROT|nr:hypothetical protein [Oleomonas cavernae]RJF87563.1 hypothetical protein D3874_11470 [Oleomonas cavernae]
MSNPTSAPTSPQDLEKIYQATIQLLSAHIAALGDKAPLPGSEAEIGLIGGCTATAVMAFRHVTGRKIDVSPKAASTTAAPTLPLNTSRSGPGGGFNPRR